MVRSSSAFAAHHSRYTERADLVSGAGRAAGFCGAPLWPRPGGGGAHREGAGGVCEAVARMERSEIRDAPSDGGPGFRCAQSGLQELQSSAACTSAGAPAVRLALRDVPMMNSSGRVMSVSTISTQKTLVNAIIDACCIII